MSEKIYFKFTNSLPVVGGSVGAFSQINNILHYFPEWETITATIVITIVGGTVGYITKLALDRCFKRK